MANQYRAEVEQKVGSETITLKLDFEALQELESKLPENNLVLYISTKGLPNLKETALILSLATAPENYAKLKKALHPQALWQLGMKVLKAAMSDPDEDEKAEAERKKKEEESAKGKKEVAPASEMPMS